MEEAIKELGLFAVIVILILAEFISDLYPTFGNKDDNEK